MRSASHAAVALSFCLLSCRKPASGPQKSLESRKKGLRRRFLRPLHASQAFHPLRVTFTFFWESIGKSVKVRESEKGIIHMKHVT